MRRTGTSARKALDNHLISRCIHGGQTQRKRRRGTEGCSEGSSLEKQSKRRRKRCSKPRLDRNSGHTGPAIEQGEPADDENDIEQSSDDGNTENRTEQPVSGEITVRKISRRISSWSRRASIKSS